MLISDGSSDVCASDLVSVGDRHELRRESAEAAHGVAKALLGRRGRRWKVLEGKARHRARLPGNETALGGGAAEVLGHGRHSVQAATERLGAAPWRATPKQMVSAFPVRRRQSSNCRPASPQNAPKAE